MESINRQMERRVWQRVQSQQSLPTPSAPAAGLAPEGLLLDAVTDGAVFSQLAKQTKAPVSTMLSQLAQQQRSQAAALRGLCRLAGTPLPAYTPAPVRQEDLLLTLRRCMGRLLRRQQEFRRLSDHGEFGCVYRQMEQQEGQSILLLSQVIGTVKF